MLGNKTQSSVRSAINAFQRHKILNTLISDRFETALETEKQFSNIKDEKCKYRSFDRRQFSEYYMGEIDSSTFTSIWSTNTDKG